MSGRDHIVLLGLSYADPSVPWAERGSAETSLTERPGWDARMIPVIVRGQVSSMKAMCNGELAVNRMIEHEGFAISVAATGFRISYDGGVFARCDEAMIAVEAMLRCSGWIFCQTEGFTPAQGAALRDAIEAAKRRGAILIDPVYPT